MEQEKKSRWEGKEHWFKFDCARRSMFSQFGRQNSVS